MLTDLPLVIKDFDFNVVSITIRNVTSDSESILVGPCLFLVRRKRFDGSTLCRDGHHLDRGNQAL